MRAVVMHEFGEPDVLALEDVAAPVAGPGEVVVHVAAVAVSRTRDVATRSGRHPLSAHVTLPHVLGGDFSGVVTDIGPGVDPTLLGKRVAAMNTHTCGSCTPCRSGRAFECAHLQMVGIHRWGSYADYTRVYVDALHLLPDGMDWAEAATLAANGPIALTQLRAAGVDENSTVLVPGATGALSTVLTALAATLGARVIGLSRRPDAAASQPGLIILDAGRPDLSAAITNAAGGFGPDVVVDNVAAPGVFEAYFPTLVNGARIVVSGAIGNPDLPVLPVPAGPLYLRSISLLGVRTATSAATGDFWRLVDDGFRLPPGLLHRRPLADAAAAHRAVTAGTAVGHVVLGVNDL